MSKIQLTRGKIVNRDWRCKLTIARPTGDGRPESGDKKNNKFRTVVDRPLIRVAVIRSAENIMEQTARTVLSTANRDCIIKR